MLSAMKRVPAPETIPLRVIGRIESCFRQKFATPRQPHLAPGSTARLSIDPALLPEHSLKGLEEFSHVWLIFHFHLNTNKIFRPKIHPPRLKGKTIGVFATRSPHHPAAIGLTLARLERIEGGVLSLSGIDLIDGTPILDVKPYIPQYDSVPSAAAGWTQRLPPNDMDVAFGAGALRDLGRADDPVALKSLITDILRHDPRNVRDRSQMREGKELAFLLHDCDVRFHIRGRTATVTAVEHGATRPPRR
jgi:tRNA-Thr(GGU) m(6)t(6)A37 methyltransferase TsaA